MHNILYKGNDLMLSVKNDGYDASIVTFEPRNKNLNPKKTNSFGPGFGIGKFLPLELNEFIIHTNKNNWYQTKEIIDVIEIINKLTKDTKVITYGGSMGGFAAINFSSALNASSFIAISPLFDISRNNSLQEDRWIDDLPYIDFQYNFIRAGICRQSHGFVFFDKNNFDKNHAEKIKNYTKAELFPLDFGSHPCSFYLNEAYKIKNIINEINKKTFNRFDFYETLNKKTNELHYPNLRKANKFIEIGDFKNAANELKIAVNKSPEKPHIRTKLGDCLLKLNNLTEAELFFKEEIQIIPNNPNTYIRLSYVYAARKNYKESILLVKKAISLQSGNPKFHMRLGEWFILDGDWLNAEKEMLKAIDIFPSAVVAPKRLKAIREKIKKTSQNNASQLSNFTV